MDTYIVYGLFLGEGWVIQLIRRYIVQVQALSKKRKKLKI